MPAVASQPANTEPSMPAASPEVTPVQTPRPKPGSSARLAPVDRGRPVPRERPPRERPARERVSRRRQEEEPKKKGGKGGLIFVLFLLVAGGLGYGWWWKQQHPVAPVGPLVPDKTPGLQALMQEGKNLVRQGKYAEAKERFEKISAEDPDFGQGAVKSYLEACEREIPNQAHFAAAADAIAKGEVGRAFTELKAVPPNTNQPDRLETMKGKLEEAITSKVAEGRALSASTGDKAKMKKLKALAEDILVARPEHRDALELRDLAARALGGPVHVEVEQAPAGDPAADVQARYASGDATGAFALANDCAGASETCKSLVEKMKQLNDALGKVEGLSAEELDRALALDHQCSGGKTTSHAKPIATRMSSLFYQKAASLKTRGEWGGAMAAARKALEAEPDSVPARSIVAEGMDQARTLFQRCYIQKDASPEDAIPLCQEVVKMLPEGNELRGKAERVLQSLRQH